MGIVEIVILYIEGAVNMFCGKCGNEVPEGNQYCIHCGNRFEDGQDIVLNRVNQPHSKFKAIFIIIPILLIAIVGVLYFINPLGIGKEGYFRDTKWGMSVEQVEKSEKAEKHGEYSDNMLKFLDTNVKEIKGENCSVAYEFDRNDKLISGTLIMTFDDFKFNTQDLRDSFVKKYEKKYGECDSSTNYSYHWTTEKSEIEITVIQTGAIAIEHSMK